MSVANVKRENLLAEILRGLKLGNPQTFRNLTIIPLHTDTPGRFHYLSMKKGLSSRVLEVREISEGGSVPELKAINTGEAPIILVDGEELRGAKQNRVVNTSLMLAPRAEHIIPVSCTEQGRWAYTSPRFADSEVLMASKARYRKSARVYQSLMANGGHDAMQSEVWNDVAELHARVSSFSHTGAMRDAFAHKETDLQSFIDAFPPQAGQHGLLVFINGQLLGLDYLSRSEVYADLHEKFIRSHAIEALAEKKQNVDDAEMKVTPEDFLNRLGELSGEKYAQSVGMGQDYRFTDKEQIAGAALCCDSEVVHLTAYNSASIGDTAGVHRESRGADFRRHRFLQSLRGSQGGEAEA
jgi:hypothetical protein